MATSNHQLFGSADRVSQSLCNDRCQNVLYKAVFEHFKELPSVASLLLASKSFQSSSFGPNFIVDFVLDKDSIDLLESVLSPSSCLPLQFVPSLYINQPPRGSQKPASDSDEWMSDYIDPSTIIAEKVNRVSSNFVVQLVGTKYLRLSLRSLTLVLATNDVLSPFFGSCSKSWPQLQHLTLIGCELNDAVLEIIAKIACQLREVNFSYNRETTDAGLKHICSLSNITSLNLACWTSITNAGLEQLVKLVNITSLDLSNCFEIGDAGLEHVSKLSYITSLNLSDCEQITDVGLEHISKLARITSLDVSRCFKITDVGLEHLSKLSSVTFLNLAGCTLITDFGVGHISKILGIANLYLDSCDKITDAGIEHISNLTNVAGLELRGCNSLTDAVFSHILKLPRLTSLSVANCENITSEATMKFKVAMPKCELGDLS